MIEAASARCGGDPRARFVHEDVAASAFEPSSLVVSYYTLQFVHPRARQDVIRRIYDALEWGGAFLLFEKVRAPDARFQDIASQTYQEFKLQREFSEAEILNKQRSLKGILEPFSTQGNLDLLRRAGFVDVMTVMKWVCFEGFLAIK
jgi:tRNA (cmo5U34)-methyltransferase